VSVVVFLVLACCVAIILGFICEMIYLLDVCLMNIVVFSIILIVLWIMFILGSLVIFLLNEFVVSNCLIKNKGWLP